MAPLRRVQRAIGDPYQTVALAANRTRREWMLADAQACNSTTDWVRFTKRHLAPGSNQLEDEIDRFVAYASDHQVKVICEVGTQFGGTNVLLARSIPTAQHVIGVDLWVRNKAKIKLLRKDGQRLSQLDGPSSAPRTVEAVRQLLGNDRVDLLLIDGDHRYDGVRQDFEAYSPLVRDGGLIAFHDIVPDGRGTARASTAYAGGVPDYWNEISQQYPVVEFVHDRANQLGFGIGVITYALRKT